MQNKDGVVISSKEAAEYCEYKRQRKRADIRSAMLKSEGVLAENGDMKKVCERAVKYRQAAVRMTPMALENIRPWINAGGLNADCLVGGNGETLSKVKAYEAKCALKLKAKELTVVLSPTMLAECRYTGIRRELKRLRRIAGKAVLKARLDVRYSPERLARVSKICAEVGVDYLSVPYYEGCERLRTGLLGRCRLEVYGVETLDEYKKMSLSGVERIVTERAEEIQNEWMKEVETITFPKPLKVEKLTEIQAETQEEKEGEKGEESPCGVMPAAVVSTPVGVSAVEKENCPQTNNERGEERDCKCRLDGAELNLS